MNEVIAKYSALPARDVHPEIVRLLPLDKLQDKIEVQKSATTAPTPATVEEACALLDTTNINAVVDEKNTKMKWYQMPNKMPSFRNWLINGRTK